MAMTKKEQAEMESLKFELRKAKAFRFTDCVEPDVPIPDGFYELSKGYLFNPSFNYWRVEPACSSGVHHSFGRNDKTDSQCARRLYSSELLAFKALRHEFEIICATELAKIDEKIELLSQ